MDRDDNSQAKFEQDQAQQWAEYTRKLLDEHEIIGRVMKEEGDAWRIRMEKLGVKNDQR